MNKLLLTSISLLSAAQAAFSQERPNIVLFLVDDMGLMDTSLPFDTDSEGRPIVQPLNEFYRTPNMERMAEQGIRFTTFYAQSVSSPSRASIMTGQNAARHQTTNWIKSENNNRTEFGPHDWNWDGISPEDMIYPSVLQKAGYKTIHVGKAHFGRKGSLGEFPQDLGFDVNIAGSSIGEPGSYYGEHGYGWIKGRRARAVPGLEKYHNTNTFITDALTIEACSEIEKAVKEKKPFYLNMSHYAVHTPYEVDKRFIGNYASSNMNKKAQAFATLIEGMDKSLGDLMNKLEELQIAENTIVIFLGDNGGNAPLGGAEDYGCCAPYKGKKGAAYEGGTRVPFIASWAKPNKNNKFQKEYPIAQNAVQNQMATIMDIYPTILSIAKTKAPKGHALDGSDLKKLFTGKKDKKHRDDFLMHFPHAHNSSYFTTYRKGDWKLIYYYNPDKDGVPTYQLYNLKDDPYEKKNVADAHPKELNNICRLMIERLKAENALYPVDKNNNTLYPVMPGDKGM